MLAGRMKAVRDLSVARLYAWRPPEWGEATIAFAVGGKQALAETKGGAISISVALDVKAGETAPFNVTAPAHPTPDDARELALIVERIEFE